MKPNRTIEFWFEFGSTYSYPAAMRIESLALKHNVDVEWRAFLLGPLFKEFGWEDSPFNLYPAKGRYMWQDMKRVCGAYGIPFNRPSKFPRNGVLASRIACRFSDEPWLPRIREGWCTRQISLAISTSPPRKPWKSALTGCVAHPG